MIENLSPDELENIQSLFERDQSVLDFDGPLPPRTRFIRRATTVKKGSIKNGQKLNDDISAYWSPKSVSARFEAKDRDWKFRFSAVPKEFCSMSWALEADEIEKLNEHTLLAFCIDEVLTQNGRPFKGQVLARFTSVKGTTETVYENSTTMFDGRRVGGFSLQEPSLNASLAYRIWIDLIVTNPTSKTLTFRDPILLMQERLTLE